MIIEIIVFLLILAIQILLGLFALLVRKDLKKTYAFQLSDSVDVALTLEKYSRIVRKANIRVNANIDEPALAQDNITLINRNKVYLTDLFTNFYVIYQLELSQKAHKFKRALFLYQAFLFFIEILLFLVGALLGFENQYIIWAALAIQIFTIALSIYGFKNYNTVLTRTYNIAADLLNLDNVEQARAEALKHDLRNIVFEYPLDFMSKLIRFLLP